VIDFAFSVAKRHKIEKYSLILHSEFELLEESQPMEKGKGTSKLGARRHVTYCLYRFLFVPISINDACNDAVNHIIKEGLAQETIVMGYDILYIEHAHDVSHEIGCF